MIKHKHLMIDAAVYTFASYLIQPLTVISGLLIKRSLGPYLIGVVATLSLFTGYSSFSHFGVLVAAERELPFCKGAGEHARFERIRYSMFTVTMVLGLVFSAGLAVWALAARSTLERPLFIGLLVSSVSILGGQWINCYIVLLRTSKEFVFLSMYQVGSAALGSVLMLGGAVLFGFGGLLTATLMMTIFQAIWLAKRTNYIPSFRLDWQETKQLFIFGAPLLLLGLVMTGVKTVDNILVLRLLGFEALGLYTIALMANSLIFSVTNSLSTVLFPRMQEAYGKQRTIESLKVYVMRPSISMGLLLPLLIGGVFFAIPVVVQWLLPRFMAGLMAFKIITLGTYLFASFQMASSFLIALNKQLRLVALLVWALIVSVVAALFLTHRGWGLAGIASATVFGYFVCFVSVNSIALRHWSGWKPTAVFLWDMILPFAYSSALLILLDRYYVSSSMGLIASCGLALLKFLLFLLAYLPLVLLMDHKTRLLADFVRPAFSSLLRRGTAIVWRAS